MIYTWSKLDFIFHRSPFQNYRLSFPFHLWILVEVDLSVFGHRTILQLVGDWLNLHAHSSDWIRKHQVSDTLSLLWVSIDVVSCVSGEWLDSHKILNDGHACMPLICLVERKARIDIALVRTINELNVHLSLSLVLLNHLLSIPVALDKSHLHLLKVSEVGHFLEHLHDGF